MANNVGNVNFREQLNLAPNLGISPGQNSNSQLQSKNISRAVRASLADLKKAQKGIGGKLTRKAVESQLDRVSQMIRPLLFDLLRFGPEYPVLQKFSDKDVAISSYQTQLSMYKPATEARGAIHSLGILSQEEKMLDDILTQEISSTFMKMHPKDKNQFVGVWYPTDLKNHFEINCLGIPSDFESGFLDQKYFEKKGRYHFVLKDGVTPSLALQKVIQGPSILDCGNAVQVAYYAALLKALGSELFDSCFSGEEGKLQITQTFNNPPFHPLHMFLQEVKVLSKGPMGKRAIPSGATCHIKGVPHYNIKHPTGYFSGMNVVRVFGYDNLGDQLFMGHGLGEPKSEQEIALFLVEGYNQDPTEEDLEAMEGSWDWDIYIESSRLKNYRKIVPSFHKTAVDGFLPNTLLKLNLSFIKSLKTSYEAKKK